MTPRRGRCAYPACVKRRPDSDAASEAPSAVATGTRREPRMGRLDALDFRRARFASAPRPAHAKWIWIAAAMLVVVALLVVFRAPLADRLWPQLRAQTLREQAAAALAQGRLTAADGSGARELYAAAIAIDPDRNDARIGLARVAQAALVQAQAALRRDDFEAAHRGLALARELQVPRASADALDARLRAREVGLAGTDSLLARAATARGQARLDGDANAALPLYQRVLSLQPQRIDALEGREDALSDLLQQARTALAAGRLGDGAAMIAAARGYDAGHVDLPQSRAELARAQDRERQRAESDLRRGELARAAARYRQLIAIDADNAAAHAGLDKVADAYALRAERAAADFDFSGAQAALREASALSPQSGAVPRARQRIAEARRSLVRLAPIAGKPGSAARVRALLRQAEQAEARGDLLTPPGDSAYDLLRAARALAPRDQAVRRASLRMLPVARACFERELPRNDLGRARACLDAWTVLEGEGVATRRAQRRLAQRWLAIGDERLGAGELGAATAALQSATSVDADTPGIADFRERLRAASASVN